MAWGLGPVPGLSDLSFPRPSSDGSRARLHGGVLQLQLLGSTQASQPTLMLPTRQALAGPPVPIALPVYSMLPDLDSQGRTRGEDKRLSWFKGAPQNPRPREAPPSSTLGAGMMGVRGE